jgi:hypothetical protein
MKINSENNYLRSWNIYEVARFVPTLNRVIRDKNMFLTANEIEKYAVKYKNTGIYTSVFAYDTEDLERATRLRSPVLRPR